MGKNNVQNSRLHMPRKIVIPFTGGLHSLSYLIWSLKNRYSPELLYITNLFPHSGPYEETSCKGYISNIYDSYNGSLLYRKNNQTPVEWPLHVITLTPSELSKIEAAQVKGENEEKQKEDQEYVRKMLLLCKLGDLCSELGIDRCINPFPNMELKVPSVTDFHARVPFAIIDDFDTFMYVASWIDETRDMQERLPEDSDTKADLKRYLGWFDADFNPWEWLACCHESQGKVMAAADPLETVSKACGFCDKCMAILESYCEHYSVDNIVTKGGEVMKQFHMKQKEHQEESVLNLFKGKSFQRTREKLYKRRKI